MCERHRYTVWAQFAGSPSARQIPPPVGRLWHVIRVCIQVCMFPCQACFFMDRISLEAERVHCSPPLCALVINESAGTAIRCRLRLT